MRYDVDRDGPMPGAVVTWEGIEIRGVVAFDTDEGWVERHRLDDAGRHVLLDDHGAEVPSDDPEAVAVATEVLRGRVEFWPAPATREAV